METQSEPSELELDDVVITNPHIEAILENEDWIEDASYVYNENQTFGRPKPHLRFVVNCNFCLQQRFGVSLHLHLEGDSTSFLLQSYMDCNFLLLLNLIGLMN